jgi:CRISPR-associated protein Csb1
MAALRRLRFPLKPGEKSCPETDIKARTALAALGLCGATLARMQCDLRSRCLLFPTSAFVWELLDKPGTEKPEQYSLDGETAVKLFNDAVVAAKEATLPWMEEELVLKPSPDLAELVRRSQQLAASTGGEEDE